MTVTHLPDMPGDAAARPQLSTAERILDAAEAAFASEGYYAATIRGITQAAGVPLNLARYHFGSKDQLFCQVLARRADATCLQLEAAIDAALARENPPSLESVVDAMLSLTVDRLRTGDVGWRNYLRLLSNLAMLLERPELLAPWRERYVPTAIRYRAALRAAVPQASETTLDLGLHFMQTLAGHAALDVSITRHLAGGLFEGVDWEQLRRHMVAYAVGGLRAQMTLDAVPAGAGTPASLLTG